MHRERRKKMIDDVLNKAMVENIMARNIALRKGGRRGLNLS